MAEADHREVEARLMRDGFATVQEVVPRELCGRLRKAAEGIAPRTTSPDAYVHAPERRVHRPLEIEGDPLEMLRAIALHPVLGRILLRRLGTTASLEELALIVSHPGAQAQQWHHDTWADDAAAPFFTVFVPVVDVTEGMGPLELRSDTGEGEPHRMLLRAGDAVVMRSTTVHRGGANVERPRPVYYCSFLSPHGERPQGATYTILRGVRSSVTLRDLVLPSRS